MAGSLSAIPRKVLGRTGVEVTSVGIGTAWIGLTTPVGSAGERVVDEDLGVQTIWAALENGVTLIDTAERYLAGKSERIVGRALRERPDLARGAIVETKSWLWADGLGHAYVATADAVRRSVEESLKRLGTDHLDLLYLHDPPKEAITQVLAPDGALAALRKLQAEGMVGHIGVASNYPDDTAPYVETGEFEMAVVPDAYSLLTQIALERIFPGADRFGMGVVVATPLERGLLAIGSRRAREENAQFFDRRFDLSVLAHVERIEEMCRRHDVSLLAAALQYVSRHPVVATTIPGPRCPDEARANALAAHEFIPEAFWDELAPLIRTWDIMRPRRW